jgi:hypothetical protein
MLADIAMYPGRLRRCTIVTEHAAGYKTTWRGAVECLIFDTSPPYLSGPQSLSLFFKHRVHYGEVLRLAVDWEPPSDHRVALQMRLGSKIIGGEGIAPGHLQSTQLLSSLSPVIIGNRNRIAISVANRPRRVSGAPQGKLTLLASISSHPNTICSSR